MDVFVIVMQFIPKLRQQPTGLVWTCIREIPGSEPDRHTGHTVSVLVVFSASPGKKALRLRHNRLFPGASQ